MMNNEFYTKNVVKNKEDCISIFLETINQNNNKWLEERKLRITGTTCYNIYTYSFNKIPNWEAKIRSLQNNTFQGNLFTEYGKLQEPQAMQCYAKYRSSFFKCGLLINPFLPYFAYSADGITTCYTTLIEVKCPILGKYHTIGNILGKLKYIELDQESNTYALKKKHPYYGPGADSSLWGPQATTVWGPTQLATHSQICRKTFFTL